MPSVAYKGSDCTTGHGCDTNVNITSGSVDVFIGG